MGQSLSLRTTGQNPHKPEAPAKVVGSLAGAIRACVPMFCPVVLTFVETPDVPLSYIVADKMKLSPDKSSLRVNDSLTLAGILAEVFDYRLGNRSALEWAIERVSAERGRPFRHPLRPEPAGRPGIHCAAGRAGGPGQRGDGQDCWRDFPKRSRRDLHRIPHGSRVTAFVAAASDDPLSVGRGVPANCSRSACGRTTPPIVPGRSSVRWSLRFGHREAQIPVAEHPQQLLGLGHSPQGEAFRPPFLQNRLIGR